MSGGVVGGCGLAWYVHERSSPGSESPSDMRRTRQGWFGGKGAPSARVDAFLSSGERVGGMAG